MHGDEEVGADHKAEDRFRSELDNKALANGADKTGPCQGMGCLHGVLMHGDQEEGVDHMHQKVGPEQQPQQAGPGEGMDFLHGVLMHGDDRPGKPHHDHEETHEESPAAELKGPCVGMDCLHGVLMHGDMDAGKDHGEEHAHDKRKLMGKLGRKSDAPSPEAVLHGDDDHVHSHDNKPVISDKHKGVPSVSDPHGAIHGDLNEQIKLGESTDKDNEDYLAWLKQNKEKTNDNKPEEETGGILGFTFPFISDSLLDDIELLKRRYLPKFWGSNEEHQSRGDSEDKEKGGGDSGGHDLMDDLNVVGDTGPIADNHGHHHNINRLEDDEGSTDGSGVRHDEG